MRITRNFEPIEIKGSPKDFLNELKEQGTTILMDTRNDIVCIEPTFDYLCLANYYDYLNSIRDSWISCGYLDLGLVPVFMNPSFMGSMEDQLEQVNSGFQTQCHVMRPVSFTKAGYIGPNDIWVKREDFRKYLSRLMQQEIPIEHANVSTWFRLMHKFNKRGGN